MANERLLIDANNKPVAGAVTDDTAKEIRMLRIDDTTKGLKVSVVGGSLGTVTSVAALTLGTTGTDLSSTVANGTTTPVITLNVPTASHTNRGVLSSTDWDTFNTKGSGTVTDVSVTTANGISGTVATSTTTPAITLALGVITPTSVNGLTLASQAIGFTIAGGTTSKTLTVPLDASVSGTNTGDNTVATALTGTPSITVATVTTTGDIELGNASDTTIHRVSAGLVSIEGSNILTATTGAAIAQTFYIGTTQVAINRASASLSLAGVTTDRNLALTGGTMTGKIVSSGSSEVGKTYTPATGAQTVALDCALNNIHVVSGHANGTAITFTVANATNSQCFIVSILQGAVVSTISAWFATIRWAGGSAPTLTATVNKRDTFGFIRTGANTYDGFIIGQNA